jgi:hypothetical protein
MPVQPWTAVTSRDELVAFIAGLRDEHRADPDGWENSDLSRFLDALAAWVDDSPGYWANVGEPEPQQPDWSWVALSLRAATGYE